MENQDAYRLPDGLSGEHFDSGEGVRGHASVLSSLLLGGILAVALTGVLGGRMEDRRTVENDNATLTFEGPRFIRNGMFFEAHTIAVAKKPIDKLVFVVSESLMHDITMNSMVPAAGEETYEDENFRFTYDKLDAGDTFDVKFDFQINPSLVLGTEGEVAVYDDRELLAKVPVKITVLP